MYQNVMYGCCLLNNIFRTKLAMTFTKKSSNINTNVVKISPYTWRFSSRVIYLIWCNIRIFGTSHYLHHSAFFIVNSEILFCLCRSWSLVIGSIKNKQVWNPRIFCIFLAKVGHIRWKQGKSEGFESCDRPSNLAQIWSNSSIFQPLWPWNLMYDLEK